MKPILTWNENVNEMRMKTKESFSIRVTKPVKLPEDFNGPIIVDLPGPMVKVSGKFEDEVPLNDLPDAVQEVVEDGDIILLGDAEVVLEVRGSRAFVIVPGYVKDAQVHVVGKDLPIEGPTEEDETMASLAKELEAHAVLISMVRSVEDVRRYSELVPKNTLKIAKIETNGAIENLKDIISEADGCILARGDLELNAHAEMMFKYASDLRDLSIAMCKPYFAGTGFLKSLVNRYIPERSEVDDVSAYMLMGYDGILLTKESGERAYIRFNKIVESVKKGFGFSEESTEVSSYEEALRLSVELKLSHKIGTIKFVGDERESRKAFLLWGVRI